jgi:hypothetical protein
MPPFDPQIRTRKSRNATGSAMRAAHDGAGSTHLLSREEKSWQEKAADKL